MAQKGYSKNDIRTAISQRFNYDLQRTVEDIEKNYYFYESCQQSVPEAIIAFLDSHDYESAIRNAIWLKGDADTQACISGAIAEAFYGSIPQHLKESALKLLPQDLKNLIDLFYNRIQQEIIF